MPEISLFRNATDTNSNQFLNIDEFIRKIQEGYWQDLILKLRTLKNKDEQDAFKRKLPMVTVSGLFAPPRSDKSITKHSGFIQIDLDKLEDVEDTKSFLYTDEYVYAGFVSSRGYGLCLIFKINPKKHREAFAGIGAYLCKKYKVIIDPTSINESRGRFVSYDPHLHYNHNAKKFEEYPPKRKDIKKIPNVIFTNSDFDLILQQIQNRQIDITDTYEKWRNIAFALADKFGEAGRDYFHILSKNNSEYNSKITDRQYDACLKSRNYTGNPSTIATIYYYAKQAGVETQSEETRKIAQSANIAKKSGKDKESAHQAINSSIGASKQSEEILSQIFDQGIQVRDEDSLISKLKLLLNQTYQIRRNEITRRIEVNGKIMDDIVFNSIWCYCAIIFEKVSADGLQRLIHSDHIISYNPFIDFFNKYKLRKPVGIINEYISCIDSDGGIALGEFYPEYTNFFFKKWLVSVVSAMHFVHSPIMLVFTGGKNTGKTEIFRRLLPQELSSYYAEISTGMKDTDFHIMMTQKIIVMDDEMETRSRAESRSIKALTSKDIFTVRSPYGRYNEDLKRLGVLCGTTNEMEVISADVDGNRRLVPIPIISIDYNRMNSVDRIDLLMEAYWLWKNGFDWQIGKEEIAILEANTERFKEIHLEQELIIKYFRKPKDDEISFHMMATEIKLYIEQASNQKTNKKNIISLMKKLGFEYKQRKVNGYPTWGFSVMRNSVT